MAKYLVIVESPAKAKTINKMLGPDYAVKASMGHVRDLPERALGVDIAHGFEPEYEVSADRKKVIGELKKLAGGAEKIFLAPDPDREGEAIAWHLRELLKKGGKKGDGRFARVTYNEITEPAIRAAFAHPGELNMRRVDSQQARRILDRIIGFKVSPVLARRVSGARSAGRVQSVALRLVCEREEAIRGFVPEPYWVLGVKASKAGKPETAFRAKLARINGQKAEVKEEGVAAGYAAELAKRGLRTARVVRSEKRRTAPPPFITSSLQQAASGACGFSPSRTMSLAQRLYEGMDVGGGTAGLITYMRTDSFTISEQARAQAKGYITKTWGEAFYPERPNRYKNRSSAQEAHEAIRPTDTWRTPDSLKGVLPAEEWKLYDLIWRRFVASQMAGARIGQRTAELEATGGTTGDEFLFRATASEVLFPGFLAALGQERRKKGEEGGEGDDEEVESLPDLADGEVLDVLEWLNDRKETQPPSRYSEAALVKALEENGVGRPSTYAQTLKTLLDREYATREKRMLVPTETGMNVNRFLTGHLGELFAVPFTAEMEEELDEIEDGKVAWRDMLGAFYGKFTGWLKGLNGPEVPPEEIAKLLAALGHVKQWRPPSQGRNRTYSDEKFVASLRKQAETGTKGFTERQKQALEKLCNVYREQLPAGTAEELELPEPEAGGETSGGGTVSEEAMERLNLLEGVEFQPPRTIGKRTYDDQGFWNSLREQAAAGKQLSERQWAAFDKMVARYKAGIADFGQRGAKWYGAAEGDAAAKELKSQAEGLLRWFEEVKEWRAPTTSKGRTWDDKKFVESVQEQVRGGKQPSAKQVSALKRMAGRYSDQLPDWEAKSAAFGLDKAKGAGRGRGRG